jgi:hypothetical protein
VWDLWIPLLLSNSKFNSFVDIANEYLGPFGGFVIGWTYWVKSNEGPVREIVCPEPKNKPVPIAPPIAIN